MGLPPDVVTELSDVELVAEMIREKLFCRLNKEVPYLISQSTRSWRVFEEDRPDADASDGLHGAILIHQDIVVRNEAMKRMVLGTRGSTVRFVADSTRAELSRIFKRQVHLAIHVSVKKDAARPQ